MRVLHHPTRRDTGRDREVGEEQWGVVNPASAFFVARPGL